MQTAEKQITIVISVLLQDAGEATRSLEIMKGIRETAPDGYTIRGVFFSHGSKFDEKILENGFDIQRVTPDLEGKGFRNDLQPSANNFVGDPLLAVELLKGEIAALKTWKPDFILYGFWPFAGLARRMISPAVPGICFLPLPLEPSVYGSHLMTDVPDQIKPLTFLPAGLRRGIVRVIPARLILKAPIMRQTNILNAAAACGWSVGQLANLFDMLKADLTVINDFSDFYNGVPIPKNYIITGPLYAPSKTSEIVDPEIETVFEKKNKDQVNIFCTMGSSGKKECLLEAVKAISALPETNYHAVILVPEAICPITDVLQIIKDKSNIYATNKFIPITLVNARADITICHGGQGTIQTALVSGSPIVGFAMQPEQQINLDHIVLRGAGIRIPAPRWSKRNIISAIHTVTSDNNYRENAVQLGKMMAKVNGKRETAKTIWEFMENSLEHGKGEGNCVKE